MNTLQKPIGSGFSASTTAEDVVRGIDLNGKIAIVTGGYSGIGLETTRVLHNAGAKVIVPARDLAKATAALAGLPDVEIKAMDLSDPASVDAFAQRFLASGRPLHILVNSAGIMGVPLTHDARGYEAHFATNHLGHFQLVTRLWSALQRAHGARVVSVASLGHRRSPIVFDDIHYEHRDYDRWTAYGQSKTANVLFALELDKRDKADGIRAFSVHPGVILNTDLKRYMTIDELLKMGVIDEQGNPIFDLSKQHKTVEQGAATSVWCATSPQLDGLGGLYCENSDVAPLNEDGDGKPSGIDLGTMRHSVMPHAVDPVAASRLWQVSEQMLGMASELA